MEKVFDSLDEFTESISKEGIKKIVFAETNEKRAIESAPGELSVDSFRLLELLAYKKPLLYKVVIHYPDFDRIYANLDSQGFEITKKTRNIT